VACEACGTHPWPLAFHAPLAHCDGRGVGGEDGVDVDWAKNLLTTGEGVVQHDDVRSRVGSPRVVPATSTLVEFPAVIRLLTEVMGVRNVMRVETLPALTVGLPPPA
jgi:hypothetical protein